MRRAAYRIASRVVNGTLALILLIILTNMGWRDVTNDESLSSRDLLKAIKGPQQLLDDKEKRFIAYAISRLSEGTFYTLPRNRSEAMSDNSICNGSRIDVEFMLPALVSAGLLGLKQTKIPVPSAHQIVKRNGIEAFKSTTVGLNIDIVPYKASDNTRQYLILQGEINDENSRQNPPPRSTDPLPNAAIAIAKDIQAEALIQYNELYDIHLLDRSHRPDVQVNTEALTQTEAVSLVTPCKEDSSCPITTSTEVITKANATSLLLPTESITYESPMHGRIIDMRKLCGFLKIALIEKSSLNSRSLTFLLLAATTSKQLPPLDPISGKGPNRQCKHLVEAFSSNMVAYL
jgi:hypothetical protein